MMTRKIVLLSAALAMVTMVGTACNKSGSSVNSGSNASANSGGNSSAGKSGSSSSGTSSTASNRFVGTWVEEGKKDDQGGKFTEDGKIIDVSNNKEVGTYTTTGDNQATITIADGKQTATATLESDTRMKMVAGSESVYLTKK